MGVLSNKINRDLLKLGDHIYSWRHGFHYSHHGIYDGEGKVIHFTRRASQEIGTGTVLDRFLLSRSLSRCSDNPCPNCGYQSTLDGVISLCLDCFLSGGDLYRFQYSVNLGFFLAQARGGTCSFASSDPPKDVLLRASFLLQNGFGNYDVFKNNCEDFAIYCKTGLLVFTMGRSGQAASLGAAAIVQFLATSFTVLHVVGCGMYCTHRLVSDIRMRGDVMKVPAERLITPVPQTSGDLYLFEYGVNPAFFIAKATGVPVPSPEDVLHRASFLVQNGFGSYDIFKYNCEDFAIYCKTGLLVLTSISVGRSGQAASIVAAATAVVSSPLRFLTTSFTGLGVVGCGMYCISRFVSDIGLRRDVKKVPVERLTTPRALDESVVATEMLKKE